MRPSLGATYLGQGRTRFELWAPHVEQVSVLLVRPAGRTLPLTRDERGYHTGTFDGVAPGARYFYRLGDRDRPDPTSRFQPEGVHGPSEVVDPAFLWTDEGWSGRPLRELVFYELHVGAFTREGTFDAARARLPYLVDLGVTAVEIMPVAQNPGERNWGYDGVDLFAVQASFGGPEGMRRFVDAAHSLGLAVILDVVYNHLGPEGNYLAELGPYFTSMTTPWGAALNLDGPGSDEVRRFFVENALHWARDFHVDGLRLDAVHAIVDLSPRPFLEDVAIALHAEASACGRPIHVIAESNANDARLVREHALGGLGLDAVWSDDFHHALHALLTGECHAYYEGFDSLEVLARAYRDGWAYQGQYSPARKRKHGSSTAGLPGERFVVCAQNHDQVGNRAKGERLVHLAGFESAKLAAATVLLSPFLPLIFMGEEYGERAPFHYFVHHGDAALVTAVREGRRREIQERGGADAAEEPLDPQAEGTFLRSKLDGKCALEEPHRTLLELHRELLHLRRALPLEKEGQDVVALERPSVLLVRRGDHALIHAFSRTPVTVELPLPAGVWCKVLDTAEARWRGPGGSRFEGCTAELAPRSFLLLRRNP
jgi:maltooligosyltrehalose trehalohydrolase